MSRDSVPKRVRTARAVSGHDFRDLAPTTVLHARRVLRAWLADPSVNDCHRAGDSDLLRRLDEHWAGRRRPRFHVFTREEIEALFTPEEVEAFLRGEEVTLH